MRLVTRTAHLFYLDKKELLMSPRVRNVLLAAAAVLALLVLLPWSRRTLRAPATLYPMTSVRLRGARKTPSSPRPSSARATA